MAILCLNWIHFNFDKKKNSIGFFSRMVSEFHFPKKNKPQRRKFLLSFLYFFFFDSRLFRCVASNWMVAMTRVPTQCIWETHFQRCNRPTLGVRWARMAVSSQLSRCECVTRDQKIAEKYSAQQNALLFFFQNQFCVKCASSSYINLHMCRIFDWLETMFSIRSIAWSAWYSGTYLHSRERERCACSLLPVYQKKTEKNSSEVMNEFKKKEKSRTQRKRE